MVYQVEMLYPRISVWSGTLASSALIFRFERPLYHHFIYDLKEGPFLTIKVRLWT